MNTNRSRPTYKVGLLTSGTMVFAVTPATASNFGGAVRVDTMEDGYRELTPAIKVALEDEVKYDPWTDVPQGYDGPQLILRRAKLWLDAHLVDAKFARMQSLGKTSGAERDTAELLSLGIGKGDEFQPLYLAKQDLSGSKAGNTFTKFTAMTPEQLADTKGLAALCERRPPQGVRYVLPFEAGRQRVGLMMVPHRYINPSSQLPDFDTGSIVLVDKIGVTDPKNFFRITGSAGVACSAKTKETARYTLASGKDSRQNFQTLQFVKGNGAIPLIETVPANSITFNRDAEGKADPTTGVLSATEHRIEQAKREAEPKKKKDREKGPRTQKKVDDSGSANTGAGNSTGKGTPGTSETATDKTVTPAKPRTSRRKKTVDESAANNGSPAGSPPSDSSTLTPATAESGAGNGSDGNQPPVA